MAERQSRIDEVIHRLRAQLAAGGVFDRVAVEAEHADLMPELGAALDRLAAEMIASSKKPSATVLPPFSSGAATTSLAKDGDAHRLLPRIEGYEFIGRIGRGGMGEVFKARQIAAAGRIVALKILRDEQFASESQLRRFEREVEIAAELHHPNIAELYDSGLARGRHYFAMQFIDGLPLDQYCRNRKLSINDRLTLVRKICDAMAYAHQRGVIHRDLKPSNLLVDASGEPHILDFGLAKMTGADEDPEAILLTLSGALLGTLPYMAPEQAAGDSKAIDTRTDVYALGVILYELLTETYPYEVVGQMASVLHNIASAVPKPPSTINRRIGNEVEVIVLRALAKEPDRRYGSASELGKDIGRFLNGEAIEAKPPSFYYQMRKLTYRHRRVVVPSALAALVVALVVAMSFVRVRADRDAARAAQAAEAEARQQADAAQVATEAARVSLEREAYFMRIALADRAIKTANYSQAGKLLVDCPPALRGWEWRRLEHMRHLDLTTWTHPFAFGMLDAAVSPDGKRIATACGPRAGILVWDATTGKHLLQMTGHLRNITGVAYSPDSTLLASSSDDGTVRLWDSKSGTVLHHWTADEGAFGGRVAFLSGGKQVAAMFRSMKRGQGVRIWNIDAENDAQPDAALLAPGQGLGFAVSPDATLVVTGGAEDGRVHFWDARSGKLQKSVAGHQGDVRDIAFSPDGHRFASAGLADTSITIWDTDNATPIARLKGHTDGVWSIKFSPDGSKIISSSSDGSVRLWDVADGRELHAFWGHTGQVTAAVFSTDGRRIISCDVRAVLKTWDVDAKPIDTVLRGHAKAVRGLAVTSGTPPLCYSADIDRTIKKWDLTTGVSLDTYTNPKMSSALALCPHDDVLAASTEDSVLLIDTRTGQRLQSIPTKIQYCYCMAFSPDGKWLAALGHKGEVEVWSVVDHRLNPAKEWMIETVGLPGSLVFSPDSRWLAVSDGTAVTVWDHSTANKLRQIGKNVPLPTPPATNTSTQPRLPPPVALAISPNGKIIAAGTWRDRLEWWDADSGALLGAENGAHGGPIMSVAFSPDGSRLVSAGSDRIVKLWDVTSHREALTFEGHTGQITHVRFTPDGRRIVSASEDGTLRTWDAGSGVAEESILPAATTLKIIPATHPSQF